MKSYVLLGLWAVVSSACASTQLASQPITIDGNVVAPQCTAKLTQMPLRFDSSSSEFNQDGAMSLPLTLQLSDCLFTGVGMKLRADRIAGSNWQGALWQVQSKKIATNVYYSIGPVNAKQADEFPLLRLAADSASLIEQRYYRLDESQYWYQPTTSSLIQEQTVELPMQVTVHQQENTEANNEDLAAHFTLTLSYR